MKTRLLKACEESYKEAAHLLLEGEVVAIPTETVYGLAADALNPQAVEKIFEAKGRPQDNPLIVHIASLNQLPTVAENVPEAVYTLAQAFWPGPLTMILPRGKNIPDVVTAGLDTVGIRMPSHKSARRIIELSSPLAAPSANSSGKPSPTTAAHVMDDMNGRIPLIVDGGRCSVGVESTVVDMTGTVPKVLRPGAITEEMIAAVLGNADTDIAAKIGLKKGEKAKSPGMMYRHYAPKAPVILYEGAPEDTYRQICEKYEKNDGIICFDEYKEAFRSLGFKRIYSLGKSWDHRSHDRRLFSVLRMFDSTNAEKIHAQCPREYGGGEGAVNRMRKSAGFHCIRCTEKEIIGVTGLSGSGKSHFCQILENSIPDLRSIDADLVYHDLLEDPQSGLTTAILSLFHEAEISGRVDRSLLSQIVFNDKEKLAHLNAVAHKAVLTYMLEEVYSCPQHYVLLDVPLLFESGLDRYCTMTVGILTPRTDSLQRVTKRDSISYDLASLRLKSQPRTDFYSRRCDLTLQNTGAIKLFEKAAISFGEKYLPPIK